LSFDDLDEACIIFKLSASLELTGANDAARQYILKHMFPNQLWQAFQCAKEADDKEMFDAVMKVRTKDINQHNDHVWVDSIELNFIIWFAKTYTLSLYLRTA